MIDTYIEIAILVEYFSIIPTLMKYGDELNFKSAMKLKMYKEAIRILNEDEKLVNLNNKYHDNSTALHQASRDGILELVKLLIKKGIDLNIINDDNKTALDLAEENAGKIIDNNIEVISYLKSHGAIDGMEALSTKNLSYFNNKSNIIDFKTKKIIYTDSLHNPTDQ